MQRRNSGINDGHCGVVFQQRLERGSLKLEDVGSVLGGPGLEVNLVACIDHERAKSLSVKINDHHVILGDD